MVKRFRVMIIGGGTGGLTLAHGLRKAGVEVAVYERSASRTERLQGYRVHLNPNGSAALHECLPVEAWDTFVATTGAPGGGFGFLTEQLRELLVIEDEMTSGAERDPTRAHHSVSRITLHQVLSAGLDGILHHGKEFVRYERGANGTITCYFADGSTATGEVLVAADGANSRVRKQFLPHARRVDTGIVTIAGKLPLTEETRKLLPHRLVDGPNTVIPPKGCGMFLAPHELDGEPVDGIGGNDETAAADAVLFDNTTSYVMWAYAASKSRYPADGLSTMDGTALKSTVVGLIRDWHPALRNVVDESPAATVSLLPIQTSVPVDPWQPTNVTLVGDAIHSMTPFRGVGANTALRDAKLLCRRLVEAANGERELLDAIGGYEAEMREYGFAAVRYSLRSAKQFISENAVGRTMFKYVLRGVASVPPLKRKMFSDMGAE